MASLWYRVNQPRVQSSVYTGQWLRDIGKGTKSDILPIYQATVQYFVGISNISTIWF